MIRFDEKCWAVEETKCRTVYDTGEQSQHDDQDHDHDGNDTMKLNVFYISMTCKYSSVGPEMRVCERDGASTRVRHCGGGQSGDGL